MVAWTALTACQPDDGSAEDASAGGLGAVASQEMALVDHWEFYRFDGKEKYDPDALGDLDWQTVRLPHSARIEPRVVNDQWQGDAVYRRTLHAKPQWRGKSVWLRFEGAMTAASVMLNGELAHRRLGGYLPFVVDLSKRLDYGEDNVLVVRLDNRDNPVTGPKPLAALDFNTYGGLYREVRLLVRAPLHITDEIMANKMAGGGIFVHFPAVSTETATVVVETDIQNDDARDRSFAVRQELHHRGDVVSASLSGDIGLSAGDGIAVSMELSVDNPALWSPQSPNLHRLVTTIVDGGHVVDRRETRIGIRSVEITKEGIFINGENRFLRGVNRHQEYPYVGYAIPPNADRRDAKLVKEAGFDYVRLSHYPHSRHFIGAADELGIVLLDAILGWQYYNEDPAFSEHVVQTCRDMIRRDRNHPSVIAWECSLNESAMPAALVGRLHRAVHEEFPHKGAYSAGWIPETYDIYLQARQHRLPHLDVPVPDKPYIVSEYGDWEYYAQNAGFHQDAWRGLAADARTSRQLLRDGETRLLQQATNAQEAHNDNLGTPAIADGYWVMFDYNRGYADDLEASGLASLERIEKPVYHFFRSQRDADEISGAYRSGPMVHIANEWREGSPLSVRVYSNAEKVELLLNGESLGIREPDGGRISRNLHHPPFTFHAPEFKPGTLTAVAYQDGKETTRHVVRTPGEFAGIDTRLATFGVPVAVNDLVFVHARLRDANGTTVPRNGVPLELGAGKGLRNVGPRISRTENGWGAFLVRVLDPEGDLSVRTAVAFERGD